MCTIILKETLIIAWIICPLKEKSQCWLQEAELFDLMVPFSQPNLITGVHMTLNCLGPHAQCVHFLFCLSVAGDTNICNNCPHAAPPLSNYNDCGLFFAEKWGSLSSSSVKVRADESVLKRCSSRLTSPAHSDWQMRNALQPPTCWESRTSCTVSPSM